MHGRRADIAAMIVLLTLVMGWLGPATAVAKAPVLPDAIADDTLSASPGSVDMVLAGGCFWGIEEVFSHVRGVTKVTVGYAGGSAKQAEYEIVLTGRTGHAESAKITYDPAKISYGTLLKVFFFIAHDPTQKNQQWPDIGPQYRSVVFYMSERQQQLSLAYIHQLNEARVFKKPIVTEVVPLVEFFQAESYHQNYAALHPSNQYIWQVDRPKLEGLKRILPELYLP
jgi:peptide-methionine (S)-S-oxide reductase